MKILYIDCPSGICGDMTLAAFIDLGVSLKTLNKALDALRLPEKPRILAKRTSLSSIFGTNARIVFQQKGTPKQRGFKEISRIIKNSRLNSFVKEKSLEMFKLIGSAESKIHGIPLHKVHFHEIGAVDSICDIVAIAECFRNFRGSRVYFSKIPLGSGTVKTAHGRLPLPAPAALEILKGIPAFGVEVNLEMVTPTGAAVVKTFADGFVEFPPMKLEKIGLGFSKNTRGLPLRISLGTPLKRSESVCVIETNIDNMTGEQFGYIQDLLFERGALDAVITPILMKKKRPAHTLSVICNPSKLNTLAKTILKETTSIGLRYYTAERKVLKRESIIMKTPYGIIRAKKIYGKNIRIEPEYEDISKIAKKTRTPFHIMRMRIEATMKT